MRKKKKGKKMVVSTNIVRPLSFVPMLGQRYKTASLQDEGVLDGEIGYSSNYSNFKFLEANRDIRERHVHRLVASIKREGQIYPILINRNFEVIEGQHRVEACKILQIPVMFLKNDKATIKHVRIVNNCQEGWGFYDFLKSFSHHSHTNHETYQKIELFVKEFSFQPRICLILLVGGVDNSTKINEFKLGTFTIEDEEKSRRLAKQLLKIKTFAPDLVANKKFCLSWFRVQKIEKFKVESAYDQIKKYRSKLEGCLNQEDWIEGLLEAYSYKKPKSEKISIKKDI